MRLARGPGGVVARKGGLGGKARVDVEREAIILVAGDKNGDWSRWYDINIPLAEARYEQYISEKDKGAHA